MDYQTHVEWLKGARAIHKQTVDAAVLGLEMIVDSARKTGRLDLNACLELLSHAEFAQNHVDRLNKKLQAITEAEAKFKSQADRFKETHERFTNHCSTPRNPVFIVIDWGKLK